MYVFVAVFISPACMGDNTAFVIHCFVRICLYYMCNRLLLYSVMLSQVCDAVTITQNFFRKT